MRLAFLLRPWYFPVFSALPPAAATHRPPALGGAARHHHARANASGAARQGGGGTGGRCQGLPISVSPMLEANGFAPAVVAGTSAGSVVGALYASGMNAFELQEKAVALDEAKIRDLQLSLGRAGARPEAGGLRERAGAPQAWRSCPNLSAVATAGDGERTVFARGNTDQAVRASSSVPGCSSRW